MEQSDISFILCLLLSCAVELRGDGVTCKTCWDVTNPQHCRDSMICGHNEICSTEEFIDNMGLQAFRLGCENQAKCTLYLNAKNLFGKRELPAPAPSDTCYECCSSDGCNVNLCQRSLGQYPPSSTKSATEATTKSTTEATTTSRAACPPGFVAFKDYCYLFGGKYTPVKGESYCTSLGGHLVSIHSNEENDFLQQQMIFLNDRSVFSYWTGGYYDDHENELKWMDKTPFNYTRFSGGRPYLAHSLGDDLYVAIGNPVFGSQYASAPMWIHNGGTVALAVICKIPRV